MDAEDGAGDGEGEGRHNGAVSDHGQCTADEQRQARSG